MADDERTQSPPTMAPRPRVKHETTDLRLRSVVATLFGVALVLCAVVLIARFFVSDRMQRDSERLAIEGTQRAGGTLPRQPRLEPFESQPPSFDSFAADAQMREAQLHSYG